MTRRKVCAKVMIVAHSIAAEFTPIRICRQRPRKHRAKHLRRVCVATITAPKHIEALKRFVATDAMYKPTVPYTKDFS